MTKWLVAVVMAFSASAFAGQQPVSFADLKAACADPAKYHNQIAPKNLQLACRDMQTKWVAITEGAVPVASKRYVTDALSADKYYVSPKTAEVAAQAMAVGCPRLKEITETIEFSKALTCEEILAFKGDSTDLCLQLTDELRLKNPMAIQQADTGRSVEFCAATLHEDAAQQGQTQNQGQRKKRP